MFWTRICKDLKETHCMEWQCRSTYLFILPLDCHNLLIYYQFYLFENFQPHHIHYPLWKLPTLLFGLPPTLVVYLVSLDNNFDHISWFSPLWRAQEGEPFQTLIQCMKDMLFLMGQAILAFGGRLALLKSILSSPTLYLIQIIQPPKYILQQLE